MRITQASLSRDFAGLVKGSTTRPRWVSWALALSMTLALQPWRSNCSHAAEIVIGKNAPSPEVEYRILPGTAANALIRLNDQPQSTVTTSTANSTIAKPAPAKSTNEPAPVRIVMDKPAAQSQPQTATKKPKLQTEARIASPASIESQPVTKSASFSLEPITAAPDSQPQTNRLPVAPAPALDPAVVALDRSGMRPLDELGINIRPSQGPMPADRSNLLESGTVDPFAYARTDSSVSFQWEPPAVLHGPLYFEDVPLVYYGQTRAPYLQPVICGVKFAENVLLLPYKMCVNPPGHLVFNLRTYPRPGTAMPCLHQCILK